MIKNCHSPLNWNSWKRTGLQTDPIIAFEGLLPSRHKYDISTVFFTQSGQVLQADGLQINQLHATLSARGAAVPQYDPRQIEALNEALFHTQIQRDFSIAVTEQTSATQAMSEAQSIITTAQNETPTVVNRTRDWLNIMIINANIQHRLDQQRQKDWRDAPPEP